MTHKKGFVIVFQKSANEYARQGLPAPVKPPAFRYPSANTLLDLVEAGHQDLLEEWRRDAIEMLRYQRQEGLRFFKRGQRAQHAKNGRRVKALRYLIAKLNRLLSNIARGIKT